MKRVAIESPDNPSVHQIEQRARRNLDDPNLEFDPDNEPVQALALSQARTELLRENIQYARLLYVRTLEEGNAPFASHLNYTQAWSEEPSFRERGIVADLVLFGVDLGWTAEMSASQKSIGEHRSVYAILFPDWGIDKVRAHLASLPWSTFVGVE